MTSNSNQQPDYAKSQSGESKLQYKSTARMLTYEEIESAFLRTAKRAVEEIKHLDDSTYCPLPSTTTAGPLPFAGPTVITREQELEALLEASRAEIERLKAPQKWIPCKNRMPTSDDADDEWRVWWTQGTICWRASWYRNPHGATHWQPTRLRRPEPPKE